MKTVATNYRASSSPPAAFFFSFCETTRAHLIQRQGVGHTSIQKALDKWSGTNGLERNYSRTRTVSWRAPALTLWLLDRKAVGTVGGHSGSWSSSCLLITNSGISDLSSVMAVECSLVEWQPNPGTAGVSPGGHRGFVGRKLLLDNGGVLSPRWGGGQRTILPFLPSRGRSDTGYIVE